MFVHPLCEAVDAIERLQDLPLYRALPSSEQGAATIVVAMLEGMKDGTDPTSWLKGEHTDFHKEVLARIPLFFRDSTGEDPPADAGKPSITAVLDHLFELKRKRPEALHLGLTDPLQAFRYIMGPDDAVTLDQIVGAAVQNIRKAKKPLAEDVPSEEDESDAEDEDDDDEDGGRQRGGAPASTSSGVKASCGKDLLDKYLG